MVYDKGALLDNCWGSVDGALCAISCPGIHKQFCIIVIKDNMHGNFNHLWHPVVSLQIYMDQ